MPLPGFGTAISLVSVEVRVSKFAQFANRNSSFVIRHSNGALNQNSVPLSASDGERDQG
jgi:hypothetical protein